MASKLVTIIDTTPAFALPDPTSYSTTTSTLVDSGTSVSGKILGSVVRNDVVQISLSWNYLCAENWAAINEQFKTKHIHKIKFFNQTTNALETRDMYVSDRSAGMYKYSDGEAIGWTGCGIQLMEV